VVETDLEAARAIARSYARLYLASPNYTKNLLSSASPRPTSPTAAATGSSTRHPARTPEQDLPPR